MHRGDPVTLRQPAVDLALDDHRVDPDATVVDSDHTTNLPLAGVGIDLHRDNVGAEREGQVRRVIIGHSLETRLHPVGEVRICRECHLLDRLRLVGGSLHEEPVALELEVLLGHLEQVRGDLASLFLDLARDHGRGRP